MNGKTIVDKSAIGQISDEAQFLDGRTMSEYKDFLTALVDKTLVTLPGIVTQVCKNVAKIKIEEIFHTTVRQSWGDDTQYLQVTRKGKPPVFASIGREKIGEIIQALFTDIP